MPPVDATAGHLDALARPVAAQPAVVARHHDRARIRRRAPPPARSPATATGGWSARRAGTRAAAARGSAPAPAGAAARSTARPTGRSTSRGAISPSDGERRGLRPPLARAALVDPARATPKDRRTAHPAPAARPADPCRRCTDPASERQPSRPAPRAGSTCRRRSRPVIRMRDCGPTAERVDMRAGRRCGHPSPAPAVRSPSPSACEPARDAREAEHGRRLAHLGVRAASSSRRTRSDAAADLLVERVALERLRELVVVADLPGPGDGRAPSRRPRSSAPSARPARRRTASPSGRARVQADAHWRRVARSDTRARPRPRTGRSARGCRGASPLARRTPAARSSSGGRGGSAVVDREQHALRAAAGVLDLLAGEPGERRLVRLADREVHEPARRRSALA